MASGAGPAAAARIEGVVVRAAPRRDNNVHVPLSAGDLTMTDIAGLLGADARNLLQHVCKGIPKSLLQLPGPDFVDRVVAPSDRGPPVLRSLEQLFAHGRLAGTGYVSILPVDQGIEHSAGAS